MEQGDAVILDYVKDAGAKSFVEDGAERVRGRQDAWDAFWIPPMERCRNDAIVGMQSGRGRSRHMARKGDEFIFHGR